MAVSAAQLPGTPCTAALCVAMSDGAVHARDCGHMYAHPRNGRGHDYFFMAEGALELASWEKYMSEGGGLNLTATISIC